MSSRTHIIDPLNLPAPFSVIPRESLLFGFSPIHRLDRISDDLSNAIIGYKGINGKLCLVVLSFFVESTYRVPPVNIYAKRDDCNSGLAFGGNKTRKLEYLLAEALEQGVDTLVSIGGVQSNHTRQVAAVAAKYGLKVCPCSYFRPPISFQHSMCHKAKLVQEHWVDYESSVYSKVGNIQLSRLMGADSNLDHDSKFGIEHKPTAASLTAQVLSEGGKPYYIPAGASDHPLGGLGFARWAFEVYAQEKELGVLFDTVVVCAVTGSTFAGMIAGFKLLAKTYPEDGEKLGRRKVIGIDASATPVETRSQVLRIAKATAEKIGLGAHDIKEDDVILDERYHAGTYGIPDKQTIEAIRYVFLESRSAP